MEIGKGTVREHAVEKKRKLVLKYADQKGSQSTVGQRGERIGAMSVKESGQRGKSLGVVFPDGGNTIFQGENAGRTKGGNKIKKRLEGPGDDSATLWGHRSRRKSLGR